MTPHASVVSVDPVPSVVPVLSVVIPEAQISPVVKAALDAKASERAAFMALADELVQALRPELERLTTELVQRSLRQAWAHRTKIDLG
jgi:hypothetical protein